MQKRISTIPFTDTPEQHEKLLAVIESLKNEKGAVMAALHRRRISTATCRSKCRRRLHAVSMYLSKRYTAFPRSILSSRSLRRVSTTFPFASAPHATLRAQIRFLTVSLQSSASSRRNVRRTACSRSLHVAASAPAALHRSSPSTKTFTAVSFPRTWIRFLQNTQRKPCVSFR